MGDIDARRRGKAKARQQHWLERQERSKLNRSEIEMLQVKRDDMRKCLSDKEASGEANTIDAAEETIAHFNQLPLSQRTLIGLERGNYKKMTPIQRDTLHLALAGFDVLGAAKTGSGKTLCFVIPVLEGLFLEHWEAEMGVGALLLSPTRELALQIFKVMQVVGYKHVLSAALLTGGRDVQEERKRLHAISIIVGTPGRVLHHLQDDADLVMDNLQFFCMDEADRLLDLGFRESITNILKYLPPQRQTLLFSATQTTDVQMLAQMSLNNPRYVTSHAITSSPTPSTLCQNFIVVELHRKLDALLMFLKRHPSDKVVVFVSTCNQVKYMYLAFSKILKKMRIPSMCLTSKMKQFRREEVFLTFCRCKSAVLFCTDVAARGLDFPLVHWVIQYDCPDSAQTYIHRAGRTARAGARGVSLLFLTPREAPMLSYLASKNIPLREIAIRPAFQHTSTEIFVALVVQGLKYEAQKAFVAYLRSVYFASNKHVFDVASINVELFARSLGLMVVPDMSELLQLQRGAKNLPWDVVNYIAKRDANAGAAKNVTKRERHLQASDMFRVLEQKQRFAPKGNRDAGEESDDDFLVKKVKVAGGEAVEGTNLQLSIEERLAGLSKHKKRKYIENPNLRVKDLGLSQHEVLSEDDEEGQISAPNTTTFVAKEVADAIVEGSGSDDDDEDGFANKLRRRMGTLKEEDNERVKKLRRLRRLQKMGKISKRTTLNESGVTTAVGGPRPDREYEDESDYDEDDSDAGSNGSLARLIKAARGELYSGSDDNDNNDDEAPDDDEYQPTEADCVPVKRHHGNSARSDDDDDDYADNGDVHPPPRARRRK